MGMFSFDTSKGETPESVARKRKIADAFLQGVSGSPRDVGQGLSQLGDAIAFRMTNSKADAGDKYGTAHADEAFSPIMKAFGFGGSAQAQPDTSGAPVTPLGAAIAPKAGEAAISGNPTLDIIKKFEGFQPTAKWDVNHMRAGYGSDTVTLADGSVKSIAPGMSVSREDADRDLARRAQEFQSRAQSQVGADAWAKYNPQQQAALTSMAYNYGSLPKGVVSAAMSGDPQALANAVAARGSDNDGVNQRRRAQEAQMILGGGNAAAQGVQVASNDPQQAFAMAAGGQGQPLQGNLQPQQQNAPQQAPQGGQNAISMEALMKAASDPWVMQNPTYAGIVQNMLQQRMQPPAQDKMSLQEINGHKVWFNESTGQVAKDFGGKPAEPAKPIEVGGRLVDPVTGKVMYESPQNPTGTMQEYQLYVQDAQKRGQTPLGPLEYQQALKGGMQLQIDPATGAMTFQQGANIKPLNEGQSKDVMFSTKASGALPNLEKFGNALTGFGSAVGANTPLIGNYMKSGEYQQAEQAGKEFLTAILRKESGAAIGADEEKSYGDMYLPRPGDSEATIAQKKESRARAIEAINAGMPAQAILAKEQALLKGAGGPKTGSGPVTVNGYQIEQVE